MADETLDQTQTWPEPVHQGRQDRLTRGQSVGRYVVLEQVGDGGMGVVYSAYDPKLDRRVALKLLRAESFVGRDMGEARLRLRREAQALARIDHPNVVGVYDTGVHGDGQVFVAMEFVEGLDLRRWLAEERRAKSWRQVLEIFLQAGEGLAAAHRAGLLHRDFKPANVILGKDGRARVADFGLARPADPPTAATEKMDGSTVAETRPAEPDSSRIDVRSRRPDESSSPGSSVIDVRVTRPGEAPGTPAYMAPEQLRGQLADARSDQFAFCIALYEALYGRSAFGGGSRRERLASILDGPARGPARNSAAGDGVPAWLEKVVVRGLAAEPAERYPSMDGLLAELRRRPRRRWLVAALLAGVVAAGLGFSSLGPEPCSSGAARLEGVWDGSRRADLLDAFGAAEKPYAVELGRRAAGMLDQYADAWQAMVKESCQATRRGDQSPELLDLRTACLNRRLEEVRALTDLLVAADSSAAERAISAVSRLGSLASCADGEALRAVAPRPTDPQERKRIENLERLAAETKASYLLGQGEEARARAERLAELSEAVSYAPAVAESFHARGLVASFTDRKDEAKAAQLEAASWADTGGHDEIRVLSLLSLAWASEPEQARQWLRLALGTVERGDNPILLASWLQTSAGLHVRTGDYGSAVREAEKAVELSRRHQGESHRATGRVLATLGSAHYRQGHYAEALETFTEVARIRRANMGPRHPEVAYSDHARGELSIRLGRYAEALEILRPALEVLVEVHGERHSRVVTVLSSIGKALYRSGELDSAEEELGRVVELRRELSGEGSPVLASALNDLALVHWSSARLPTAEAGLREALGIHVAARGEEHPETLITRVNLGRVLFEQGRIAAAERYLQAARVSALEQLGADHPTSINAGLALGEARIDLGSTEEGVRMIGEAAAGLDRETAEPWLLGLALVAEAHAAASLGDGELLDRKLIEARSVLGEASASGLYFLSRLESSERQWRRTWKLEPAITDR